MEILIVRNASVANGLRCAWSNTREDTKKGPMCNIIWASSRQVSDNPEYREDGSHRYFICDCLAGGRIIRQTQIPRGLADESELETAIRYQDYNFILPAGHSSPDELVTGLRN